MPITVNMHEAKTHFSKIIARVQRGEDVVIAMAGKPVARVVPVTSPKKPRRPGSAAGKIKFAADFLAPLPDAIVAGFEGAR
jgi:prevent-host-death family protein